MKYCKGYEDHIDVEELESKAFHDDDLYLMVCLKCGKREKVLARRPNQTIMPCEDL